ncbi:Tryptophan synthase alpha chain [uncultured archaeon]|nr:Tryptophan synthase alpha chain [uncultured archaeon]
MSSLTKTLIALKKKSEGGLIAFIIAGDPDESKSLIAASAVIEGGADVLELGLPFSDPVADGPTIQAAGQRALNAGMTPDRYFKFVSKVHEKHPKTPLVCLTYYNLVLKRGLEKFASDMKTAGIDGLICPDIPLE